MISAILAVVLLLQPALGQQGVDGGKACAEEHEAKCSDQVFLQTEARILERVSVADQIRGWEEFLALHPDNPCSLQARRHLEALKDSEAERALEHKEQRWKQEARGGVVEPNQQVFPPHGVFPDASASDSIRVLSELIWLGEHWKSNYGEENRKLSVKRDLVWTSVLHGEMALVSHLGFFVDVPMVLAQPGEQDLQGALGNIALGIKGVWGTRLGKGSVPWVIAGGVTWGTGSSVFSGKDKATLLNAAAVGGAYMRHLYLYDSPDYVISAESQLQLGRHSFGLALAYHVYAGGEHVEKILRYDLLWDWEILGWAFLGLELNGGLGSGEAVVGAVENEFLCYVYASPAFRMQFGRTSISLALRVPLGDAWGWSRLISSVNVSLGF